MNSTASASSRVEQARNERTQFLDYLLLPFRAIYKIYYLFVFCLLLALIYPAYRYLLAKPERYPGAFRLMRFHATLQLFFAGIILRVKGTENIPATGAFVICPNHTSFLDTFCLYHIFRRYFVFTGKKEIEKWPLFHIFYTSGMNILIDRGSAPGSFKAFRRMNQEIGKGNPLVIFVEGTRSPDAPRLAPFKPGAFAIAIQAQVPVLPVTFVHNWKRLGRGGIFSGKAGPGISEVVIHPPVTTAGFGKNDVDELLHRTERIIEAPLLKN